MGIICIITASHFNLCQFLSPIKHCLLFFTSYALLLAWGPLLLLIFSFLFFAHDRNISRYEATIIRFLSYVVTIALIGIVVSGFFIFLSDPARYFASAKFMTKMTVVLVLCINGYLLHRYVFSHITDRGYLTSTKLAVRRNVSFALGSISFVSWITAMSLGVFDRIIITYKQAVLLYGIALIVAVITSQIISYYIARRNTSPKK